MVFKYISILGIEKVFTSIFPNIVNLSHSFLHRVDKYQNWRTLQHKVSGTESPPPVTRINDGSRCAAAQWTHFVLGPIDCLIVMSNEWGYSVLPSE